jgi:hypothetical protein
MLSGTWQATVSSTETVALAFRGVSKQFFAASDFSRMNAVIAGGKLPPETGLHVKVGLR